jgi:alpha-mannosidase
LHVEYALIPHQGKWDESGIGTKSNAWNEKLLVSFHENIGMQERSFLQFDRKGYELTAFKLEGEDYVLRIFNQESDEQALHIRFGFPVAICEEIALSGEIQRIDSLNMDNNLAVTLPRFGIKTFRIKKATDTNNRIQ